MSSVDIFVDYDGVDTGADPVYLTTDYNYLARGKVNMLEGTTLYVAAGVVIFGENATAGYVAIDRGARVEAIGRADAPIIMTSDQEPGYYERDWPTEDEDGNTISDNVLLGEEVVVDYESGMAFSIPAISFQGSSNDGNREYDFDDACADSRTAGMQALNNVFKDYLWSCVR